MINLKTGKHFNGSDNGSFNGSRMTRGGFLKGILASGIAPSITLATIANAGSANASVGRGMMRNVGARNAAMFGGGGWKNPYITDGLIAMWDGEWNAGGGVHDDTYDGCVDLSSNGNDLSFIGSHSILSNSVMINGVSGAYAIVSGMSFGTPSTQEGVIKIVSAESYGRIVAENRGIRLSADTSCYFCCYGWGFDGPPAFRYEKNRICYFGLKKTLDKTYTYNGVSEASVNNTNLNQYSGITTLFNRIGKGRGVDGYLYNFRFYNKALTSEEIAHNYSIDKARFNLP